MTNEAIKFREKLEEENAKGPTEGLTKRVEYSNKIIVCGGRDFRNEAFVWKTLDAIHAATPITDLMQGGCPTGADRIAGDWAKGKRDVQPWVCKAKWEEFGPSAGPRRNARMLEWKPDRVIAFEGGTGTADMVRKAKAAGVPVTEVT